MDNQQTFSHGLLYSIEPEDLAQLHLNDESGQGDFEWDEYGMQAALDFMKLATNKFWPGRH